MTSLTYQIRRLFVLLLDAKVTQLLNANNEHIKLLERRDRMRHVLFGTVKLPDFDTTILDDILGLLGILANSLNLVNEYDCLIIDWF